MREINVHFTVAVPSHVSDEQLQEWLAFELNNRGEMSSNNPMCGEPIEADSVEFD